MRLRLEELQAEDGQVRKIRVENLNGNWKDFDGILPYQGLPYVSKIIRTELISMYYYDLLAGHFGIKKTRKLIARKYYWETLRYDIKVYIRGFDICIASKTVKHKPYENRQQLLVPTHCWKDLSIDFVTELSQSADWWGNGYDLILINIDWLTKIVRYELVQIIITTPTLAEVIFNIVVWHYGLSNSIVSDCSSVFTPSSGPPCATSWASNEGFLLPSTLRPTAKLSGRTIRGKLTLEPSLITKITTERGPYPWRNLRIITQNMPVRGTCLLSSTAGTTHAFSIKTTSTLTLGPNQLISWLRNLWISWLHIEKTYNTSKNCKNKLIIKELSLEVMLSARRFDWIINISKPNVIGSWRQRSLGLFKFCTWWVAKLTNMNCQNNGGSMTFSTYPC